jgi:UMF1 family MFS transporter
MLGKFASVIGPFLMGGITLLTGNIRFGILSILLLFILGALLLRKVDFKKGEEEALNFEG